MKKIKAVLFDMDGVIFDTERVYMEEWEEVFRKYGYKFDRSVYLDLMGTGRKNVKRVFKEVFGENLPLDDMYKDKDAMIFDTIRKGELPIKQGAVELLSFLKENGYKIALATSAIRERLDIQIKINNMYERFDAMVCGDDITKSKPDPEIFLKAAEKLGVVPEECIVVEDSAAGIKGAYDGKMLGFHVEDLKAPDEDILKYAYKTFKNLDEIREYLSSQLT